MKKLLIIPMLFVCFMSYGQTLDSASIIGLPMRIGDLLVAQNDFPKMMKWDDATAACAALGDGWRLPSKDELNILYQNKNEISGFADANYWSSTELDNNGAWSGAWRQSIENGFQGASPKDFPEYVRAVRAF